GSSGPETGLSGATAVAASPGLAVPSAPGTGVGASPGTNPPPGSITWPSGPTSSCGGAALRSSPLMRLRSPARARPGALACQALAHSFVVVVVVDLDASKDAVRVLGGHGGGAVQGD